MDSIGTVVVPVVASWLVRVMAVTLRVKRVNFDFYQGMTEKNKPVIFAFWHGRMLMMATEYRGRGLTVLASQHRDGEMVARFVKRFGIKTVRGSSSKGGATALKGLLKAVKDGRDIGIIPDGPRGPARVAQSGAVQVAKLTGLPLIPVGFGARKKKLYLAGIHF